MLSIEEARGIAATAWCKCPDKVMDVDLAEAFANILIEQEFKQMAKRMYEEMNRAFPSMPDFARGAARIAIGVLVEGQL